MEPNSKLELSTRAPNWSNEQEVVDWLEAISPAPDDASSQVDPERYEYFVTAMRDSWVHEVPYPPLKELAETVGGNQPDVAETIGFTQCFDRASMYLQAKHTRQLVLITLFALLFLVFFELYAHLDILHEVFEYGFWPFLIIGIVSLLISAALERGEGMFSLHHHGRSRQTQLCYLDSRCISEMGRILAFWRFNGINKRISDEIPRWCGHRLAIVETVVGTYEDWLDHQPVACGVGAQKLTREHWEFDQIAYFHKACEKQHLLSLFWKEISSIFFYCGLVGILGLLACAWLHISKESLAVRCMLTMTPSVIACAAIVEFYMERKGFEANVSRYRHAAEIFSVEATSDSESTVRAEINEALKLHEEPRGSHAIVTAVLTLLALAALIFCVTHNLHAGTVIAGAITAIIPSAAILFKNYTLNTDLDGCGLEKKVLDDWIDRLPKIPSDEWDKQIIEVGEEALGELIQWYISASDRIVTMPKG